MTSKKWSIELKSGISRATYLLKIVSSNLKALLVYGVSTIQKKKERKFTGHPQNLLQTKVVPQIDAFIKKIKKKKGV